MHSRLLLTDILRRFRRYKLNAFFMLLGSMLGVLVLITVQSLVSGLMQSALDYFDKTFLPNSITLARNNGLAGARELTQRDVDALLQQLPELQWWTPLIRAGRRNLNVQGNSQQTAVAGVNPSAQLLLGQGTVSGEYFTEQDMLSRARVVLLGKTTREALFPDATAIGQQLTIDNLVFTVQGELESLGADPHGGDLDNNILLPYTTLQQMTKTDDLGSVRFMVDDAMLVESTAQRMREILREQHNIGSGEQDDFYVSTIPSGMDAFKQFERLFKLLFPLVVLVIFLVATLVICCLMLVNVKARTAEIGLRKALGARTRDVELQFLAEALLLSCIAALAGTALSYPLLLYVQGIYAALGSEVKFLPSVPVLLIAWSGAVLTGLLAAWWPARKAAALSPVTTLR